MYMPRYLQMQVWSSVVGCGGCVQEDPRMHHPFDARSPLIASRHPQGTHLAACRCIIHHREQQSLPDDTEGARRPVCCTHSLSPPIHGCCTGALRSSLLHAFIAIREPIRAHGADGRHTRFPKDGLIEKRKTRPFPSP